MIRAFFFSKILKSVHYASSPFDVKPTPKREVFIDWKWQEYNVVRSVGKKDRNENGKMLSKMSKDSWVFLGIADDKLDTREYVGESKDGITATKSSFDNSKNKRLVLEYMKDQVRTWKAFQEQGFTATGVGKHFNRGGKGSEASWAVKILKKLCRDSLVEKRMVNGRPRYFVVKYQW
jgi:hypothetical protein